MAAERVKDEKSIDHVTKAELLNGTFTPIPSNREAVVLSAKSLAAVTEKVGARNSSADSERIQSMHDTSVSLGAAVRREVCRKRRPPRQGRRGRRRPGRWREATSRRRDRRGHRTSLADVDTSGLPEPVAQAIGLLTAADAAMDELMT
jgi:hypothetical protein